ncbi:OsmC family protein [Aestuariispira insulae]|uniref:Organic hydroperoxide reductase OsmC/OhrA n=1 Tax=Aestuariispira insulae TaxID=1461337 RepID=A0A3D9HXT1_9PROT|nr:OsmC family protein [Aestuariispira insulae]RED54313.1 organic hydroperoxide reductase OsmC/OhrA [Aestuariispira insulae]
MGKTHNYQAQVTWTGGWTHPEKRDYRSYSREHLIEIEGKAPIRGASDPSFLGDPTLHNPEEMLVVSLSTCHLLWYLHLCTVNGIEILDYVDRAEGTMAETSDGGGHFTAVVLHPSVTIKEGGDPQKAMDLHKEAHAKCFIANSVNFPVSHAPEIQVGA